MPGPFVPIPNISNGDVGYAKQLWRLLGSDTNANVFNTNTTTETAIGSVLLNPNAGSMALYVIHNSDVALATGTNNTQIYANVGLRIGSAATMATDTQVRNAKVSVGAMGGTINTGASDFAPCLAWCELNPLGGFAGSLYVFAHAAGSYPGGPPTVTNRGLWVWGI